MSILTIIGWCGAASLLLAFGLNVFGRLTAQSKPYLLLNLIGSLLLLYNAWMNKAYPFVAVNFVWVLFSAYRLIK
jgi:hypothetical protein